MTLYGYFSFDGYLEELKNEIGSVEAIHDRLLLSQRLIDHPIWAQNVWYDSRYLPINSISDAVKQLKSLQLRWSNYSFHLHRRNALIAEQLSRVQQKPLQFLGPLPNKPLGSWTLIDNNLLLASPHCSSPFVNGEIHFQENKIEPPSRAYLKLWELFTVQGVRPQAGQVCLDLGSSPGGWTWVLAKMGCEVISVDKAPLQANVAKMPKVTYLNRSAFSIKPNEFGKIDWLFSDVICYPQRLLGYIRQWLDSGLCTHFVCTIKLQGAADANLLDEFKAFPGSRLIHLYHNKHEMTWICNLF
jgi:23S rRNA (cytidine2498-2'-O)-methyltransferase